MMREKDLRGCGDVGRRKEREGEWGRSKQFLAKKFPVMAVTLIEEGLSSHSCFNYFTPAIL
jgi:hypothetical protein